MGEDGAVRIITEIRKNTITEINGWVEEGYNETENIVVSQQSNSWVIH